MSRGPISSRAARSLAVAAAGLLPRPLPAVGQAAAFLVLEVLERVLAGAPLSSLLAPLLPVGVALQLLVGAAGGLVLAGLDRAGEVTGRAAGVRRSRPRRPAAAHRVPS